MRNSMMKALFELASGDKNVILITADLGFGVFEDFAKQFPNQFINIGIAEQNMIGVASGLARAGKKPYVYSGSIFLCMRAYEQIRDDVAYQNLNVKLIGTGASGFLGFTHNMSEMENEYDLLKNLPNLDLFFPKDSDLLKEALLNDNPTYIRI